MEMSQGNEENQAFIIRPPNELLRKVDNGDADSGFDESRLRKAEAVVAELKQDFSQWVCEDLSRLRKSFELACSDGTKRREHLDTIADVVHEIKGEVGTYNYPLMTQVAESLQNFVSSIEDCRDVQLEIVGKHVEALEAIIRENLEGSGGETGTELTEALGLAVKKYGDQTRPKVESLREIELTGIPPIV